MFPDIGGSELIIVAIVALLVVKPKDLPVMMRKIGEFMGKARRMANDFRASFDDMARQSELDDLRKEVEAMRANATDPTGLSAAISDTRSDIQAAFEPTSDPNFDYGFGAPDEVDTSVAWDGANVGLTPGVEPKPKAPRKARTAARPAEKPIVEGGPKKRAPANSAAKPAAKSAPKTKRAT